IAHAASHPGRAAHGRPRPGGRRAVVGRAHQRLHARTGRRRREPAARGRQPARHAKLRGRPIGPVPGTKPDYQRSPISRFHFARRRLPRKQGEPTMAYSLRNALRGLVLAAGILPIAAMAAWPEKPVTLIVPWAAGGSTDILARMLSEHMTKRYGQPVIVENRSGASGNIGSAMVARAAPDGYTLLIGSMSTHTMNEALYDNMPFDGVKSFTPIAQLALVTNTMVVNPSVPANSVQEFIEYARANPQDIAYASAGPGSTNHLSAAMFEKATGIEMMHVPYRGGAPAVLDTVANRTQLLFSAGTQTLPHVQAGKLKLLAVTETQRSPLLK